MTISFIKPLLFALLLFALASPCLCAQSFQQPTPEELSMTADPKAPGADAVYLYNEEIVNNESYFHSYYVRIKILTEKGKELATVKIPYLKGETKVKDIKGRTIHPDGSEIPLKTKPTDLVEFKLGKAQVDQIIFTLPSVDVGSIIEYKLEIHYQDHEIVEPRWDIQQDYFVHQAHYLFIPSKHRLTNSRGQLLDNLMYSSNLPPGSVKQEKSGKLAIEINDVPPVPREDWAPPINNYIWHVYCYYSYASDEETFWLNEGDHWIREVLKFTQVSAAIHTDAFSIVKKDDSEETKARKLYDAIMKFDNTDFSRSKSSAEMKIENLKPSYNAEDVWNKKSGNSNEIALLYYTLLKAVDIKTWPIQVANRDRATFDSAYLSLGQLDAYIIIANINGKEVFLDPGERYCTFGEMHWKHYYAGGLRANPDWAVPAISLTPANSYKSATTKRFADITLAPDGSFTGNAHLFFTGPMALAWRQLTLTNDLEEIKKQFNEYLHDIVPDGVHAEIDHFLGLDDYNSQLIAVVHLKGNLGTATGKRYFLPGHFFESQVKHPFVSQAARIAPIDVHYAKTIADQVIYHLPDGYTVESLPKTADINWPQHAIMSVSSEIIGSDVTIKRIFTHNYTLLPAKDYNDLHDYYLKVAAADQQQLVLTRTSKTASK